MPRVERFQFDSLEKLNVLFKTSDNRLSSPKRIKQQWNADIPNTGLKKFL